jgi:hypothetical protein
MHPRVIKTHEPILKAHGSLRFIRDNVLRE